MDPITLYYAPAACSLAPHILLTETGLPFAAVHIDIRSGKQHDPEYARINPKRRVPALAVGDWVLTENPAILGFIAQLVPDKGLWPVDPRQQACVAEWLAWIASTLHPAYAHVRRTERYATSPAALADVRAKGLETCRDLWRTVDKRLGAGPWALGDTYSPVDPYLFVFWNWGRGEALGFDMARDYPNWDAHARRVAARPAVAATLTNEGIALPAAG